MSNKQAANLTKILADFLLKNHQTPTFNVNASCKRAK